MLNQYHLHPTLSTSFDSSRNRNYSSLYFHPSTIKNVASLFVYKDRYFSLNLSLINQK